jgi:hypothetical protein
MSAGRRIAAVGDQLLGNFADTCAERRIGRLLRQGVEQPGSPRADQPGECVGAEAGESVVPIGFGQVAVGYQMSGRELENAGGNTGSRCDVLQPGTAVSTLSR